MKLAQHEDTEIRYIIHKSPPLRGRIKISGSKNAALPIMAACVMVKGTTVLDNVPPIGDVYDMAQLLNYLGADVFWLGEEKLAISVGDDFNWEAVYPEVRKIRASNLLLGALLASRGRARIMLPGGCNIGNRPMDLHLKGFSALGAEALIEHGYIEVKGNHLQGANVYLDFPSVGATENIMIAATGAEGVTTIENAAKEPEIVDLANFLNTMGAKIRGAGTDLIKIEGKHPLMPVEYSIIPDRMEAGTFMIAAAISGGELILDNVIAQHLQPVIAKLKEIGTQIEENNSVLFVKGPAEGKILPTDIKTLPYPGFPTDLQSPFMALSTRAKGTSVIVENIFENRLQVADEMRKMGAKIKIEGQTAIVIGVDKLYGGEVTAPDLRAGAALVLCGLVAEGKAAVLRAERIKRGYANFDSKLRSLGALIEESPER